MKKHSIGSGIKILTLTMLLALAPFKAQAWGPERVTYTNEVPASRAVFNSITNNAAVGDEREFVRIREKNSGKKFTADAKDEGFLVEPGKTYEVYIYYHNDAASNTNETGAGVATDVRMNSHFTYQVTPEEPGFVNSKIMADNTTPEAVWDELKLISKEKVTLNYVANSAVIHNDWGANGMILVADKFFSNEGALLGVDSLNGVVFGCAEFSGYVTYELIADVVWTIDDPTCDTNPEMEGCKDPEPEPEPEPTCKTNPEMEGCKEMPDTGPMEIVLAAAILLGIGGGVFYLVHTRRTLAKVNDAIINGNNTEASEEPKDDEPKAQVLAKQGKCDRISPSN